MDKNCICCATAEETKNEFSGGLYTFGPFY